MMPDDPTGDSECPVPTLSPYMQREFEPQADERRPGTDTKRLDQKITPNNLEAYAFRALSYEL
jgi:hypothetical protein